MLCRSGTLRYHRRHDCCRLRTDICHRWVPIIFIFFPETKNLELEVVDHIFTAKDPVRASLQAGNQVAPIMSNKDQVSHMESQEPKRHVDEVEG